MGWSKQAECLSRYDELNGGLMDMLEYLFVFCTIPKIEIDSITSKVRAQWPNEVVALFNRHADKFQMIHWEWVVLPYERIKITLITSAHVKEFTWGE